MYQTSKSKGQELVAQRMVSYFRKLGHDAYLITSIYHDGKEILANDLIGDKGYILIDDAELNNPNYQSIKFHYENAASTDCIQRSNPNSRKNRWRLQTERSRDSQYSLEWP